MVTTINATNIERYRRFRAALARELAARRLDPACVSKEQLRAVYNGDAFGSILYIASTRGIQSHSLPACLTRNGPETFAVRVDSLADASADDMPGTLLPHPVRARAPDVSPFAAQPTATNRGQTVHVSTHEHAGSDRLDVTRFKDLRASVARLVACGQIHAGNPRVTKEALRAAYDGGGFGGTLYTAVAGISDASLRAFLQRDGPGKFLVKMDALGPLPPTTPSAHTPVPPVAAAHATSNYHSAPHAPSSAHAPASHAPASYSAALPVPYHSAAAAAHDGNRADSPQSSSIEEVRYRCMRDTVARLITQRAIDPKAVSKGELVDAYTRDGGVGGAGQALFAACTGLKRASLPPFINRNGTNMFTIRVDRLPHASEDRHQPQAHQAPSVPLAPAHRQTPLSNYTYGRGDAVESARVTSAPTYPISSHGNALGLCPPEAFGAQSQPRAEGVSKEVERLLSLRATVARLVEQRNIDVRAVTRETLSNAYVGRGKFGHTLYLAARGMVSAGIPAFVKHGDRPNTFAIKVEALAGVLPASESSRSSSAPASPPPRRASRPSDGGFLPKPTNGAMLSPRVVPGAAVESVVESSRVHRVESAGKDCIVRPAQEDCGRPEPTPTGGRLTLTISNAGRFTLHMKNVELHMPRGDTSFSLSLCYGHVPAELVPGASWSVDVKCDAPILSQHSATVRFVMEDFSIARTFDWTIVGTVGQPGGIDASVARELLPSAPFVAKKKRNMAERMADANTPSATVGERPPPREGSAVFARPLRWRDEPKPIWAPSLIKSCSIPLTTATYKQKMRALLVLEELAVAEGMHEYDIDDVFSRKTERLLWLSVPGLVDRRPSVLVGDRIKARLYGADDRMHEGIVHEVRAAEIGVSFHHSFHASVQPQDTKVHVEFVMNRLPLQLCQRAVDIVGSKTAGGVLERIFPSNADVAFATEQSRTSTLPIRAFYLPQLNAEQGSAVRVVLSMAPPRKSPFFIFGPPGTGKTATLVEAALNVISCGGTPGRPRARLLLCAPSNAAADILASRLHRASRIGGHVEPFSPATLLRMQARGRPVQSIAHEHRELILQLSPPNRGPDGFAMPSLEDVLSKTVVVTTLTTAAVLYSLGVDAGHFTHVMVDEAGQAHEPEVLCALAGLASPKTQIVLTGDHKQLGPVILSAAAEKNGLGLSLVERLTLSAAFSGPNAQGAFVKLVRNYRAHAALVHLPSQLFYGGELVAAASALHEDLVGFRGHNFPVLFQGVSGKEDREGVSPSWFNLQEINEVHSIVRELTAIAMVAPPEIAVISPYHQQVRKLRVALRDELASGLRVGSVEEFQGGESRVVILSTVRSNHDVVDVEVSGHLGFVRSPKRFNVAITRAQSLLVVVGNEAVLSTDANWKMLIEWAKSCGQSALTNASSVPSVASASEPSAQSGLNTPSASKKSAPRTNMSQASPAPNAGTLDADAQISSMLHPSMSSAPNASVTTPGTPSSLGSDWLQQLVRDTVQKMSASPSAVVGSGAVSPR